MRISVRRTARVRFRTGDMAVVSGVMLVLITAMNVFIVATPPAPGVDTAPALAFYIPFSAAIYACLVRAIAIQVRVDARGVMVRNFWRTHHVEWKDFDRFEAPSESGSGTRMSAVLHTRDGDEIEMTAIQARNFNVIAGRADKASGELVSRMSDAAARFVAPATQ